MNNAGAPVVGAVAPDGARVEDIPDDPVHEANAPEVEPVVPETAACVE
jgi:hypothetical protein